MVIDIVKFNNLFKMNGTITLTLSVTQDQYSDNWECNTTNVLTQANEFVQIFSKASDWSGCYADDFLTKLYLADLNTSYQQNKLFFDVGANKGYSIALWLSLWMPQTGVNPRTVHHYLAEVLKISDCGVCFDCNVVIQSSLQKNDSVGTTLEIHAFEPMESTYKALVQMRTWTNVSTLHIHQLAVSNSTGRGHVNKCPAGIEWCGLTSVGHDGNGPVSEVQTITLDDFVEQKKIKRKIDFLKIDAEGADPLVLQGAEKLLSQEKIRMLVFENHNIGAWRTISLFKVINSLSSKGLICYMVGKTGIVRLTNCWSPVYEVQKWSNVMCVHRREMRLRRFLDQLLITSF
jgi:FkbM family methyltransferase